MPKGERSLPGRCVELIGAAEALIHVGDFFAASVLEELRGLLPAVMAVHGNVDDPALRRELPAEHEVAGGFQIFNPGSPTERRRAPRASMGLLSYSSGRLSFQHVWL